MGRKDRGTDGKYENLATKSKRGEYEIIEPLDLLVMKHMPKEGTMFAGLYPLGETVKNLAKKITDEAKTKIDVSLVSTRMRVLQIQGLVVKKNSVARDSGGTAVWQLTEAGQNLLKKKGIAHGGNGGGGE